MDYNNENDEAPRKPDDFIQDRLLSNSAYDQDEELHKIIIQSRNEFMEQEKQRIEKEHFKKELKKQLAVPISRLTLWKNTTTDPEEKQCLHHILNILYVKTHPDRDDDDIAIPYESVEKLQYFLDMELKPSKLYHLVYDVCIGFMILNSHIFEVDAFNRDTSALM